MKNRGQADQFIPAWTKSKTKNMAVKAKLTAMQSQKKLPYKKIVDKHGKLQVRKFRAGGYNNSGKNGSARGNQTKRAKARKASGKGR